jgi:hypothetical protein
MDSFFSELFFQQTAFFGFYNGAGEKGYPVIEYQSL